MPFECLHYRNLKAKHTFSVWEVLVNNSVETFPLNPAHYIFDKQSPVLENQGIYSGQNTYHRINMPYTECLLYYRSLHCAYGTITVLSDTILCTG